MVDDLFKLKDEYKSKSIKDSEYLKLFEELVKAGDKKYLKTDLFNGDLLYKFLQDLVGSRFDDFKTLISNIGVTWDGYRQIRYRTLSPEKTEQAICAAAQIRKISLIKLMAYLIDSHKNIHMPFTEGRETTVIRLLKDNNLVAKDYSITPVVKKNILKFYLKIITDILNLKLWNQRLTYVRIFLSIPLIGLFFGVINTLLNYELTENSNITLEISKNIDEKAELLLKRLGDSESGCLFDIARHFINSKKMKSGIINTKLDDDCKKRIFSELSDPWFFRGLNLADRNRLITDIIETAKSEQKVTNTELSILYTFRALYVTPHNMTNAINDFNTAYELDSDNKIARAIIGTSSGELISDDDEIISEQFRPDLFNWQNSYIDIAYSTVSLNESNKTEITNLLIQAFLRIKHDNSIFAINLKLVIAEMLSNIDKNYSYIDEFLNVHGSCDALTYNINKADCWRIMFLRAYIKRDKKSSLVYANKATKAYKNIHAHVREGTMLITNAYLHSDFLTAHKLRDKLNTHIKTAKFNRDSILQAVILDVYANHVIGFLLQNHAYAQELFNESLLLLKKHISPDVYKQKAYNYIWRELEYGDKKKALKLMLQKHNETNFESKFREIASLIDLSYIYSQAKDENMAVSTYAKAKSLFNTELQKRNSIDDLLEFIDILANNNLFDFGILATDKVSSLVQQGSYSQEKVFEVGTKTIDLLIKHSSFLNSLVSKEPGLYFDNLKRIKIYKEWLLQKNSKGEFIYGKFSNFQYYVNLLQSSKHSLSTYQKTFEDRFKNRYSNIAGYKNMSILQRIHENILEIETEQRSFFYLGESIRNTRSDPYLFLSEYYSAFEERYESSDPNEGLQLFIRAKLIPHKKELLLAAYLDLVFGYDRDSTFSSPVSRLVLLSLTSELIGIKHTNDRYLTDAFEMLEGRLGSYRDKFTNKERDMQAITMYVINIANKCKYLDAFKILDKYKYLYSAAPNLWENTRNKIFASSTNVCN